MNLIITHTRQITFEVYDVHPEVGDYCVFANEVPEKTDKSGIDFILVQEIRDTDSGKIVLSSDLYNPVMLKYCWKLKMSVHD